MNLMHSSIVAEYHNDQDAKAIFKNKFDQRLELKCYKLSMEKDVCMFDLVKKTRFYQESTYQVIWCVPNRI